jgi:hypothetical protein
MQGFRYVNGFMAGKLPMTVSILAKLAKRLQQPKLRHQNLHRDRKR